METTFVSWEAQGHGRNVNGIFPNRYKVTGWLGGGSGGSVWKAEDRAEGNKVVALKSITKHSVEAQTAIFILRELKVMRHLAKCNSVVKLHDAFRCGPLTNTQCVICFVLEAMDMTLEAVISSDQVDEDNVAIFTYQLLSALQCIHACGLVHRDLKPTNVLVNADCTLKVADFGSARDDQGAETMYVTTRLYRAPELLLGVDYNNKVDMFAAGCIVGEMLKSIVLKKGPILHSTQPSTVQWVGRDGEPAAYHLRPSILFPAGHYAEQMRMILRLVGFPSDEDIRALSSPTAQTYVLQMKPAIVPGTPTFHIAFPGLPVEELELLAWLLQFSPSRRCSADQALRHRWLCEFEEEFPVGCRHEPYNAAYENAADVQEVLESLNQELVAYEAPPSDGLPTCIVAAAAPGDQVMLSSEGSRRLTPNRSSQMNTDS